MRSRCAVLAQRGLQVRSACIYIRNQCALKSARAQGMYLSIANLTPCMCAKAVAVFLSTVVMQSIRRPSLLRMYGDHSRKSCVRAAHTLRMHDAVGVCIAPLPRTFCVWFARRSHSDFF